jgi:hypothetical protein
MPDLLFSFLHAGKPVQDWRRYQNALYNSHDIIPVQLVKQGLLQTKCGFTLDHYFDVLDAAG